MEQILINNTIYGRWMYRILLGLAFASNISTGASSIFAAVGLLLVLIQSVRTRISPPVDSGLAAAVLIYLGIWVICGLTSREASTSVAAVGGAAHRILPLFLTMLYVHHKEQMRAIILAFAASVCINDITAFAQLGIHGIEWLPPGHIHNPTYLASHLLMAIPVLCFFSQQSYMKHFQRPLLALALLSGVLLLLTQTRGAWLAAAGTSALLFALTPQLRRVLLAAALIGTLLLSAVILFSPTYSSRLISISDTGYASNQERIYMWQAALDIFRDHPILGVGMDEYGYYYNTAYIPDAARERPRDPDDPSTGHGHPHNNFLKHLSEGGIFGAVAFLLLHGYLFYRLYQQFHEERRQRTPAYALMGILVFAGIHLEGLTDTNINQLSIAREYWLLMGLTLASGAMEHLPHTACTEKSSPESSSHEY